jgi:hypothetical protein
MSVEVDRRVFVQSVAAGLPLLAGAGGGATVAFAQRQTGPTRVQDPVFDQSLTDMKGAVRGLSQAGSGEHARRLASSLRVFAAWGASKQFDSRVKETLRGVVGREGRDALLRRNVDLAMFKAEARDVGFDGTSSIPLPEPQAVDFATRHRVLDDLLAHGATPRWREVAATLDDAARSLDRIASARSAGVTLIRQVDPSICRMINQELSYLNIQMVFWCAPWFYWVPEPCAMATSAYLGVWSVGWWYGC